MIEWEFYSKRRNINLAKFIVNNNIETYEQLADVLALKGITAPAKALFQSAYATAFPPIVTPAVKPTKTAKKRRTATKRTSKRTTKPKASK